MEIPPKRRKLSVDDDAEMDGTGGAPMMLRETFFEMSKEEQDRHLWRQAFVVKGTPEWNGMSEADAVKRQQVYAWMLVQMRRRGMYVTPSRLTIHGLPRELSSGMLKSICEVSIDDGDSVTACEIRKSPGTHDNGFVTFSSHGAALACLKQLNNNPEVFSSERRPIVCFSIGRVKRSGRHGNFDEGLEDVKQEVPEVHEIPIEDLPVLPVSDEGEADENKRNQLSHCKIASCLPPSFGGIDI